MSLALDKTLRHAEIFVKKCSLFVAMYVQERVIWALVLTPQTPALQNAVM